MSKPRHLKVIPRLHAAWEVTIGNTGVGEIYRMATEPRDRPYEMKLDHDGIKDNEVRRYRTMKECREALPTLITQPEYEAILDAAFKAGYKG